MIRTSFETLVFIVLTSLLTITPATMLFSQNNGEICDNGIDDDNDGLIDLNDSECACSDLMANSLIPNPSFEDMNCCPTNEAQLNCANTWIQASEPTTDYVHTCGVLGNPFLMNMSTGSYEAPLPFPDGQGGIGFRDGKPNQPNFKEYAGACLTESMTIGTMYRLDFFVGFHDAVGSTSFDMAVFGTSNCGRLPFGSGDAQIGCPTNEPGWDLLGEMTVSGMNEWKNVIFEFEAGSEYEAIVLGPACAVNEDFELDPYFFFDRLVLAESIMFEVPLAEINGSICDGNIELVSSDGMGTASTYQWYKDGIAIQGETNMNLIIENENNVEGVYEVVVTTNTGCFNGQAYNLEIPIYNSELTVEICPNEIYEADNGDVFDDAGMYELNFTAQDGCDSLVSLTINLNEGENITLEESICEGEVFELFGVEYTSPGVFNQQELNQTGCFDNYTIVLTVFESVITENAFTFCSGQVFELNGESFTESGEYSQSFTAQSGCDSTLIFTLTEIGSYFNFDNYELCEGESIEINGELYSEPTEFVLNLFSIDNCDSTIVVTILGVPSYELEESYEFCSGGNISINGETFEIPGNFVQNFQTQNGCDSIIHLTIIENQSITSESSYEICEGDSVLVNNITYNESGQFTQTLSTTENCDSILVINISAAEVITENIDLTICAGDSLVLNGEIFIDSGEYIQALTSVDGCDSTLIINITQNEKYESTESFSICEGDEIIINNETYNAAGNFVQNMQTEAGCDSIINIQIIQLENVIREFDFRICEDDSVSVNNIYYNSEGTFEQLLTGTNGCDSTLQITIIVENACNTCIFDEDLTNIEVEILKLNIDNYSVTLYDNSRKIYSLALNQKELQNYLASYAIEHEFYLVNGSYEASILLEEKIIKTLKVESFDSQKRVIIEKIIPQKLMQKVEFDLNKINYDYNMLLTSVSNQRVGSIAKHKLR